MTGLSDYINGLGHPAYMPYLTVGDPDFESSARFAVAMIDQGADLIELGIAFSDPTADGPVIQSAMQRALGRDDFSLTKFFETAARIHAERPTVPLVILTYLNPVLAGFLRQSRDNPELRGAFDVEANLRRFLEECRRSGVRGLVIPDLPHDQPEAALLRRLGEEFGVEQILMVAPNTSKKRFKEICKFARGFIYYVTSLGVTGERASLPPGLPERVGRLRKKSGVPVLAGFGFSKPEQVQELRGILDGVIVGSLHHRLIEQHGDQAEGHLAESTSAFVKTLRSS